MHVAVQHAARVPCRLPTTELPNWSQQASPCVHCIPLGVHYSKGNGLGDWRVHVSQPATNDADTLGVQVLHEGFTAIQIVLVDAVGEIRLEVARQQDSLTPMKHLHTTQAVYTLVQEVATVCKVTNHL